MNTEESKKHFGDNDSGCSSNSHFAVHYEECICDTNECNAASKTSVIGLASVIVGIVFLRISR